MVANAKLTDDRLKNRIASGGLPDLGNPFGGGFDGISCTAVFMHLEKNQALDAAISLRNNLKENGSLLLSFPVERRGLDRENRDIHGRLFTPLSPDYLILLFERVGFTLQERWKTGDGLGRADQSWYVLHFRLRNYSGTRPIDLIEGVLNKDKKTATYKLALFRAMADIATTEFGLVEWVSDGTVGIPLRSIAEKWVEYYWPIIESTEFIPQIRGESENGGTPIAFRNDLMVLINHYRQAGGFSRFILDIRGEQTSDRLLQNYLNAIKRISNTIVSGPVTYAGGSLDQGRLLNFDRKSQLVLVPSGIWNELSLVGHWIQDAVTLRWAELTEEISRGSIRPSQMIDLLLNKPIPERDVNASRALYESLPDLTCAWTGARIGKSFAVDHIIPYSLWHNNDLWNLVPVTTKANSSKSDRLPSRELLHRSKSQLVYYWEAVRRVHPRRFDYEAYRLTGSHLNQGNWQADVFSGISSAIEYTAYQRGIERWEP